VASLAPSLFLYAAAAAVGLLGVLAQKQVLFGIAKPVATVLLLAVLGVLPADQRGYLLAGGIVLSLAADIALLADGRAALASGLMLFLLAHLCYGLAFWGARPGGWLLAPGLAIFGLGSLWLFRYQRRQFGLALCMPIAVHALTLTLMVAIVFSTLAGQAALRLSLVASLGAVMFYFSQALLPWVRLRRASRWAQSATLVTYWAGQLCLVLAARWGLGEKLVP
jgi:alkenylglycerophosphocholine hydrolase